MKRILLLLSLLVSTVSKAQTVGAFTDQDYQKALRNESRVLFYSFSPSMPLSIDGLAEIRRAAAALHATLVPLADPSANPSEVLAMGDPQIRFQKSGRLRDQGIQLHYPSVVVSNNHKVVGRPIEGFKSHGAYVTMVSDLLKLPWTEEFEVSGHVAVPGEMNMFFKPVYGTDLIASGSTRSSNFLLDFKTRAAFPIPNIGDPGPTPDGEFVTILSFGLRWYSIADILSGNPSVLLADPGLRTYQSIGQLGFMKYRVLGALSSSTNPAGLIVREYEASRQDDGSKTIAPIIEWRPVCNGKTISIPMLSKTGNLLAGSYQDSLRVFRIGAEATDCDEIFDAKQVTGKADFSRDDRFMLYVSRTQDSFARMVDTIFLADLLKNTAKPIYYGDPAAQLAFPGFQNEDRIVVYNQTGREFITLERTRKILP